VPSIGVNVGGGGDSKSADVEKSISDGLDALNPKFAKKKDV